jgi:hypothetical protein
MDADTPKEPPTGKPEGHELTDRDLESATGGRRSLKVSDPRNADEVAKGLLARYPVD